MPKPTISGPAIDDVEYPSASKPKLRAVERGPPISPVAYWVATWNVMNETPISTAVTNSDDNPGAIDGSAAPTARPHDPASIGRRTPMRSANRPAGIANTIGRTA